MRYFFFIMTILLISNNYAQKAEELPLLKKYAGEYSSQKVLNDKKIKPILTQMMGKEYEHLITNLLVTGPVDLISGSIVIQGNAPHQGGEEMAILDINLPTGIIRAAIFSNKKIVIYSDKEKYDGILDKNSYEQLPTSILNWIIVTNSINPNQLNKPRNVIIK